MICLVKTPTFQNYPSNPRFMLHKVEKHKQASSISYSNRSGMCFAFLEKLTVSIEVDEDKDGHEDDDEDNEDSEFDKLLKSDQ